MILSKAGSKTFINLYSLSKYLRPYVFICGLNIFSLLFYGAFVVHYGSLEPILQTAAFGNKSMFGILLAAQLLFLLPLFSTEIINRQVPIKTALLLLFISMLLLLFFTFSRSAWIGFAAGSLFIVSQYFPARRKYRVYYWLILSLSVIGLSSLIFFKQDSTNGRFFIYKIAGAIYKDYWLKGIGWGQYKVKHNLYQAAYFEKHGINSREALLADNTFYAFNDAGQFIIEGGLAGLVLLLLACYYGLKHIRRLSNIKKYRPIYLSATASLLCIVVASFFLIHFMFFPQPLLLLSVL